MAQVNRNLLCVHGIPSTETCLRDTKGRNNIDDSDGILERFKQQERRQKSKYNTKKNNNERGDIRTNQ